jgi:hypothetical protein
VKTFEKPDQVCYFNQQVQNGTRLFHTVDRGNGSDVFGRQVSVRRSVTERIMNSSQLRTNRHTRAWSTGPESMHSSCLSI